MPPRKPARSSRTRIVPTVPTTALIDNTGRHNRKTAAAGVESIKLRALRTEELTQRAHRFNFQLAIDLREILQSEFDTLEKFTNDPKVTTNELKSGLMSVSNKITLEVSKQIDVQKKIAEAYKTMFEETTKMSKEVLAELDVARLTMDESSGTTRLLDDVMHVITETVEYWASRPEFFVKKMSEIRKESPRENMDLTEMLERLENQMKHVSKALEHPLAGPVSISKDFAKLTLLRR